MSKIILSKEKLSLHSLINTARSLLQSTNHLSFDKTRHERIYGSALNYGLSHQEDTLLERRETAFFEFAEGINTLREEIAIIQQWVFREDEEEINKQEAFSPIDSKDEFLLHYFEKAEYLLDELTSFQSVEPLITYANALQAGHEAPEISSEKKAVVVTAAYHIINRITQEFSHRAQYIARNPDPLGGGLDGEQREYAFEDIEQRLAQFTQVTLFERNR